MNRFFVFFFLGLSPFIKAQVGIGTTTPDPGVMLDVRGAVQVKDGTEGEDKVLVSDTNGKGSWQTLNDGVKTVVVRSLDVIDPVIWTHPEGIEVKFLTGSETVVITNNCTDPDNTDDVDYRWDVVIEGDARTASGREAYDHYMKQTLNIGDSVSFDLGDVNSGWFRVIASNHDDAGQQDGFVMNIIYYTRFFNGTVQFWDQN